MQRTKILANLIFLFHWIFVFIIMFGWYFSALSLIYIITLSVTFITQIIFGYCVLTKWEFDLRKKLDPTLNYDYSFLSWYAYKYSNVRIPSKIIKYISLSFLFISIIIFFTIHLS